MTTGLRNKMEKIILDSGNEVLSNERGMFSFVLQYLACQKCFYRNNNTFIYFDMINKSSFFDKSIKNTNNVWEYFFKNEIKSKCEISSNSVFWTEIGNFYGYSCDLNDKYIRKEVDKIIKEKLILKDDIKKEIDLYYNQNIKGNKVLGIHKRGTDIGYHHDKKKMIEYFSYIDAVKSDYDLIFLSTDERNVVDEFKKRYDNVINYSYKTLSTSDKIPSFALDKKNGYQKGKDAIIDAYILSKCDFLLKTNSNLSNFSVLCNENLKFKTL